MRQRRGPARPGASRIGSEPVRDWLKTLPRAARLAIGEDIKDVEFSWPIGMPLCRNMGQGVWEVRTQLRDRIARVLFCVFEEQMVLLHGFIKKSRKTPPADLELARQRKRDLENPR